MALLPPRKGNTRRRPGSKGLIMGDMVRGVERVRAWPRKRGKSKTEQQKAQTEAFRQAQWAFKYQDAAVIDTITEMVAGTPLMPRDLFLMMVSGRAFAFQHEGEPIQYSMAAVQDVSESLDVISPNPGYMLLRGPQFWEGHPVPSGGLGAMPWTVIDDKIITSPIANWDVSVIGYTDVQLAVIGVTASVSSFRAIRLSTDGGVTFFSTNGNYQWWSVDGVTSNGSEMYCYGTTAATAARSGLIFCSNISANGVPKFWTPQNYTNRPVQFLAANQLPITNIRFFNAAGGTLNAGRLLTIGR